MQEAPSTEAKISRNVKKTREVNAQEAFEYLQRPTRKINDPNKDLKKAYEKGHLDDSKFEYIRELKDIRSKKKNDSVSSHGATDDEDFNIAEERSRKIPKQVNIDQEQSAERPTKKKRKIRFAVKLEKPVFEQKNEEGLEKQNEIDSAEVKENNAKNQHEQERESQQIESRSTEKMQEALQSVVVVQPKEKNISKSTRRRNKKNAANVEQSQDEKSQADKGVEQKSIQSGSIPKQILSLQPLKSPNSQVLQDQAEVMKVKQNAALQNRKLKRLTRQSVLQADTRKEQHKGRSLNSEGKSIINSRTKIRQTRVRYSTNDEDAKKPVQRRRRNRQQASVSTPKQDNQEQTKNNIVTQPVISQNAQLNVMTKRRRALQRTDRSTNNDEKIKRSSNSRSRTKNALQPKVARGQTLLKKAGKTPETDKQARLSINSKVVIESLNFFQLKRKSPSKEKKKQVKKYYIQSQSDDEEYPTRRHKASKGKRYRKICIEESDDSSDDIIEKKRRHSRKDKQRRKRQYSSSDDMSEVSESHVFRTKQRHYRSRYPKEPRLEIKQEQR